MARFFSTNHNSLLRIATNEIASFWKDRRSRHDQMAFFRAKAGQRRGKSPAFALCWNLLKSFRYYIKQIDSMLPCVLFSNRSQKTSKCGKNISDTLGYASCATFLFLPHFDVICDLLLNRRTTWNLFVKWMIRCCFRVTSSYESAQVVKQLIFKFIAMIMVDCFWKSKPQNEVLVYLFCSCFSKLVFGCIIQAWAYRVNWSITTKIYS